MKQTLHKILLLLVALTVSICAKAQDYVMVDGIHYYVYENTATVTKNGSDSYTGSIVIPETITYNGETYSVTSIGDYAFYACSGLTALTIPNSVTSIGRSAFFGCSGLTALTIPNSVTSIGEYAFYYCPGLTSITIPNSVTSIGESAFSGCSGLTALTIPNSVTSIGEGAFFGCSGLTSITIPNSVTSIGEYAFYNCSGLTSITIPNSVTSIGKRAFSDCSGLNSIIVESGNTTYDSRNNCNAIIEKSTNTLITGCKNTAIPNSVTSIGEYAFSDCTGLTSITIPNSVTSIGENAFFYCEKLEEVKCFAENVPETATDAFYFSHIENATLYVEGGSINAYQTTTPWSNFGTIKPLSEVEGIEDVYGEGVKRGVSRKYIKAGRVIIEKDGKRYNTQGVELR